MKNLLIRTMVGAGVLLALTTGVALAKPGHEEGRLTITGPGVNGVLEITDPNAMATFDPLGFMSEWNPYIETPQVAEGDGYTLTYSVKQEDGSYRDYDSVRYLPNPAAGPGYVYYAGYPAQGGAWFQLSPASEAALQQLLTENGVSIVVPALASQPETAPVQAPAPALAINTHTWASGGLIALGVALMGLLAVSGLLLQLRTRSA